MFEEVKMSKIIDNKFNKLVKEASSMENMIDNNYGKEFKINETKRNENIIKMLKNNIELIQDEYIDKLDEPEYLRSIELLEDSIKNFEQKL